MNAIIDETIERVERLFMTVTGVRPPHLNGNGAPMPPESDPLAHVEDQLGRLLAVADEVLVRPGSTMTFTPPATAWRDERGYVLALDVPGVTRDQIDIRLERETLTVRGRRRPAWTPTHRVESCEPPLGELVRSFPLPSPVPPEHVTARLADGVLVIRIDHTTRGETSQIPIRS